MNRVTCDELQVAETRSKGTVSGKVYGGYFHAGGNWCVIATVVLLCVLAQTFATCSDFFISQWVNMEEKYVTIRSGSVCLSQCRDEIT